MLLNNLKEVSKSLHGGKNNLGTRTVAEVRKYKLGTEAG